MAEYVVVGDTAEYEDCLIKVCFGGKEQAEKEAVRLSNSNTKYKNIRVEAVEKENQWWHDKFYMAD